MNQQTGGRKKLSNHHTPAKEPFTAGPPQCLSNSVEESGTSADRWCHHPAVWNSGVVKHLPASGCCYAAARRAQLSGCRSARCRGIISDKVCSSCLSPNVGHMKGRDQSTKTIFYRSRHGCVLFAPYRLSTSIAPTIFAPYVASSSR
jgi:hypothetical protein